MITMLCYFLSCVYTYARGPRTGLVSMIQYIVYYPVYDVEEHKVFSIYSQFCVMEVWKMEEVDDCRLALCNIAT